MSASTARAAAEPLLEHRPYRIQVAVAFDRVPAMTSSVRERLLRELRQTAARVVGRRWELDVVADDRLFPVSAATLNRLTHEGLRQRTADRFDKVVCLAVAPVGAGYRISAREWDSRTRDLGPITVREANHRDVLAAAMLRAVQAAFRPVLRVERADANAVVLQAQGGVYPVQDPAAEPIRPGDVIRPLFRYLDRERRVRQIQYVPWTYLIVEEVNRERVRASLVTGLRNPLASSRRRLVEVLAVRVRPHFDETRLRLVARADPEKPLAGYKVSVAAGADRSRKSETPPQYLVSDRDGALTITADPAQPVVWLRVHSGDWLLARVPFVPGVRRSAVIELPDDSLRLEVEGQTDLLLNRLVDTVARRAVLMSRALTLAKEGDWEKVDKQLKELDALPGIRDYEDELNVIRAPVLKAAQQRKDRAAEYNVRTICRRVSELIHRYLDEDKVRALREEIAELRKLDAEDRAAIESE